MAEKMTKRDYFGALKSIIEGQAEINNKADIIAFIDKEVALLDKKSDKSKETKTKKANDAIQAAILTVLADVGKPSTISELMEDTRLATYTEEDKDGVQVLKMSNQKLSAIMKKLVDGGQVIKTEDKKKSYFSLV